ncbi:hypothetical protein F7984_11060 [Pradoshia sp. D12]|uniref:hypothetical protein n=1 Tax=Bacillaceae TaxID=186817 RepID=UPI00080AF40E|nr:MULTISPECIES: hypothetical protein [Bacillaceae]OCA83488.1 hypothetical protein A8L44_11680 [Bacillus sp. FJAT-27986]QFK71729.1 hypothetical protein F7984_11060 [Pradoshia sp. D12]TPF73524.1 hypothetical protein FHY44_07460 [Bacillus sp. D12]
MYRGIILLDEKCPIIQVPNFVKHCPLKSVNDFICQKNIEIATLNPHQLTSYYTRPFALYFDLKKTRKDRKVTYDYLVINLHEAFQKFTDTYPEYWNEIQSSFHHIHLIK